MSKEDEQDSTAVTLSAYNSNIELVNNEIPGKKAPQYIAALTASLAALSMGTTLAWTSQISERMVDGELGFPITRIQLRWVGSLMPLGAAALSLFIGSISDFLGRKMSMLFLIIPATIGWSLMIWAQNLAMLYCGRFITGMVAGSFCVLSIIYSSEIAQKEIRGALGSYTQLMISGGILFANLTAKFVNNIPHYTMICGAIPLVFGMIFVFMPESPIYLIKKDKMNAARKALVRLRGVEYDVDKEIKEVVNSLENQSQSGLKIAKESLKKRSTQKACVIGFGLMIFKSANGMDAVTAYTSLIFTSTNMELTPQTGTIILNVVQVVSAIFQSLVVDRSGRKVLLWLSASIMSICLTIVGISLMLTERKMIEEEYYIYVAYLPLVALIIFTIAFSLGLGPIPWLMMGEIFPQEIKSVAASSATFVSWMAAFAVTNLFIAIETSWGPDIGFFIFAICTALAVVFTLALVPETKHKTFDEIQQALAK